MANANGVEKKSKVGMRQLTTLIRKAETSREILPSCADRAIHENRGVPLTDWQASKLHIIGARNGWMSKLSGWDSPPTLLMSYFWIVHAITTDVRPIVSVAKCASMTVIVNPRRSYARMERPD